MSSPSKFALVFSELAQQDVDGVLGYTLETWGNRQVGTYQKKLERAFDAIIHNPCIGQELKESELRVFSVGEHRIFYQLQKRTVRIIRILHSSMDSERHL